MLPLLSGVASLIVAATFITPLFLLNSSSTLEGGSPSAVEYAVLFVMYLVLGYITIFFNAALVHGANERLSGGDPTLGSALRGAAARAGRIFPWAVVSATVSVILRTLEERLGAVGRIAVSLVGLAWSLVTFLVLPIIVMEGISVGDAIRRSVELFKRTWGENVVAQIGFGLLALLLALPAIGLLVLVAGSGIAAGGAFVIAIVWLIVVAVVIATLSGIFQTALYRYAVHGSAGGEFDDGALGTAFAPRR